MTQPTGEVPQVPASASPDDTVVVAAAPNDGVFGANAGSPVEAAANNMPAELSRRGAAKAAADATGMMPSMAEQAAAAAIPAPPSSPTPQTPPGRSADPTIAEHAMTDPFPDASAGFGAAAPQTRTIDPQSMAAAAAMGAPVDARAAAGRDPRAPQAAFDAPTDLGGRPAQRRGGPGSGPRSDRPFESKQSDRLQDTEFKLASKRRKQKPKEPNKLLLGLAVGLVVLVGVAVAYLFTRGDDTTTTEVADAAPEAAESVDDPEAAPLEDATPTDEVDALAAEPEPAVDEPTLFFDEAQTAPLQQGETYSIDLVGEPEGSLLQVVVDDIPQGAPGEVLPDLILPAGRHSLYIEITNGAEVTQSTPVNVYVLGPEPVQGYRANLSSVDIQTEGWAEAIRQFDEFRAAGHEGLQLAPLTDGYWNIFVPGLGEELSGATTYCEQFGLEVPVDCFAVYYEPTGAPTGDGATDTGTDETTDTTAEAMTDTSDDAMSDDDSTTTVAGG